MNIRNISVFKCLCVRFIYVFINENEVNVQELLIRHRSQKINTCTDNLHFCVLQGMTNFIVIFSLYIVCS